MTRSVKLVLAFLVIGALLGVSIEACRTPTQVTVEIRTHGFRCDEIKRLAIAVAASPETAERRMFDGFVAAETIQDKSAPSKNCLSNDRIGTLVVTPESGTGAIVVAASYDITERCLPPDYKGCIVARRAFSFIDRSSLVLPVTLELVCKNVPCGVFTSCRAGECASSKTTCDEGTAMCTSDAEPVILADGGSLPSEASVQADGAPLPPDDGGPSSDGGLDGGEDAARDSGKDGSTSGGNDGGTNICKTAQGNKDCYSDDGGVCCAYQAVYDCKSSPPCVNPSYRWFPCLGRLHCKTDEYCCAVPPPSTQGSMCGTGCANGVYCNDSQDCPATLSKCTTGGSFTAGTCTTP